MTVRYCGRCAAELIDRMLEGRVRRVCPACGSVAYRNPLPVVAVVLFNERGELLLVKRAEEPQRGAWCLPIGFAEIGETVQEAALRELQEETGVAGRIVRLLDVDSYPSDYYGDLLIVTYEAVKAGGEERPGDDAEEVGYFAAERLPPLAFRSNDKAIAIARGLARPPWQEPPAEAPAGGPQATSP